MRKRKKIEGLYSERAVTIASPSSNRSPTALSSAKSMSYRSGRKLSSPQFMVMATKYPLPAQENVSNALSPSSKGQVSPTNFENNYMESLQTEEVSNQIHTEPDKILTTREAITFRLETAPSEGFTTRQKFTEKEINRHLIRGTVCPKPVKHGGKAVEKEKAYIAMFKAPEVMDYNIETTIRKAKRMLTNTKPSMKHGNHLKELLKEEDMISSIGLGKKKNPKENQIKRNEKIRVAALEMANSPGNCNEVAKKIQINIKNISMVLSTTTPRLLGGIAMEETPKEIKKGKRPKLKLRSEVGVENKLIENVKEQKLSIQNIQSAGSVMRNEVVSNAVSATIYDDFY